MRKLLVLVVVVLGARAEAAAPFRRADDPLPKGAIARLGYARMIGHSSTVAVSPDGKWAFSGKWFDLTTGKEVKAPVHVPEGGTFERFFSDGSYLVRIDSADLLFRSKSDRSPVRIPFARGSCTFDVAGKFCLQCLREGNQYEVALIDLQLGLEKGRLILSKMKDEPFGGGLSSDGKHAAWLEAVRGNSERGLRCIAFYDVARAKSKRIDLPRPMAVAALQLSPDGKTLALNDGKHVDLIDPETGKVIRTVEDVRGETRHQLTFSPDNKEVAVRTGYGVLLVPLDPRQPTRSFPFTPVAILSDSKRAVCLGRALVLAIHDLKTGKQLDSFSRFSDFDGVRMIGQHTAASWNATGLLVTWDVRNGKVLSETTLRPRSKFPYFRRMRFSPDGRHVAAWTVQGPGVCVLAETATGKILQEVTGPVDRAVFAFFHPTRPEAAIYDPNRKAYRGVDLGTGKWTKHWPDLGTNEVWMTPDGRTVFTADLTLRESGTGKFRCHYERPSGDDGRYSHVTLLNRGRDALVVGDSNIARFDLLTGRLLSTVPLHEAAPRHFSFGDYSSVSADGRWVAVVLSGNREVGLFDLASETPEKPVFRGAFPIPTPFVFSLALDRNGSRLITAHLDGTCYVWDVKQLIPPPAKKPDDWDLLGRADPAEAQLAIAAFAKEAARAVKRFAEKLTPVVEVAPAKLTAWVADLDSEEFDKRTSAERHLAAARDQAEAALQKAVDKPLSLEQHRRAERLLKRIDPANDPVQLRQIRAVEILERIGSKEAIALLEKLAKGAPAARLTREAKESLARLKARDD